MPPLTGWWGGQHIPRVESPSPKSRPRAKGQEGEEDRSARAQVGGSSPTLREDGDPQPSPGAQPVPKEALC